MPMSYEPYTASHVLAQLQLLVFSALAFSWLMRNGIYPPELRSVNLDSDWLYRGLGARLALRLERALQAAFAGFAGAGRGAGQCAGRALERLLGPRGLLARTWPSGSMALGIMTMLLVFLLAYYAA
jgi:multicomponent Na+:H+ antiporter subunit D